MSISEKLWYYIVLFGFRLLSFVPLKVLFFLSEGITFLVYYIIGYRRKVVMSNLKNAFPDSDAKRIKHLCRKYYRHLSVMMVEDFYLRYVSMTAFKKHLHLENKALFDALYRANKNIIVVLGHFGNWEYGSGLTQLIDFNGAAVYKQLSSVVFDKIYFDIRSRLGVKPIEMKSVFKELITLRGAKEPFALFMVGDQAPGAGDPQYVTQFLNQKTGFYLGTEKLAVRFDMPVVYIELIRINKGSYRVIPTLICDNPTQTKPGEITQAYVSLLEQSIIRSPRYWLWSHKRWKHAL